MTAPDRITVTFDNWRNPNAGAAYKNDAGETEYVRADLMQELIAAYEDIMDYGIVFAKKEQQDRLKAAKEKLSNG